MGQFFSALDKIWGSGATVCFDGGTNCEAVGTGEGHGDKLFVLLHTFLGGPAVLHDLLDGDVEHDFFLLNDNGRAHKLGVFWKGPSRITVLDPGPGFAGVELKQYAFLVKVFVHALVVEHGHMQTLWRSGLSAFYRAFLPRLELSHIASIHADGRVDGGAPEVQGDFLKGQGRFGRGAVSLFYCLQF